MRTAPPPATRLWGDILALVSLARALRDGVAGGTPAEDSFHRGLAAVKHAGCPLLAEVYAPLIEAIAAGPLTIGQVGQSLDGRVATENGHSRYINGQESLDHLHRLRALADAVVVGASTVALDDPQLTTRRVAGEHPVRVIVDPRRRLDRRYRVFDGSSPSLTVHQGDAPDDPGSGPPAIRLAGRDGVLPPLAILAALRRRGLRTVLIEGGPTTLSAFLEASAIDRLHIAIAPIVLGSGPAGLRLPPIDHVGKALRLKFTAYPIGGDLLFDCRPLPARDDSAGLHQVASMSA